MAGSGRKKPGHENTSVEWPRALARHVDIFDGQVEILITRGVWWMPPWQSDRGYAKTQRRHWQTKPANCCASSRPCGLHSQRKALAPNSRYVGGTTVFEWDVTTRPRPAPTSIHTHYADAGYRGGAACRRPTGKYPDFPPPGPTPFGRVSGRARRWHGEWAHDRADRKEGYTWLRRFFWPEGKKMYSR